MTASRKPYYSSRRSATLLLSAVCVLTTIFVLIGVATKRIILHGTTPTSLARDQPVFSVDFGDAVAMRISKSAHYDLNTNEGAEEWAMLMPRNGHVVYVDDGTKHPPKSYTVTLFHQLKCLDVIREYYIAPPDQPPSSLLHHCMNYLRQTIWCRPNLWLESAKNTEGTASRAYDAVCRDWTKVYDEADRNYDAYLAWTRKDTSNSPEV